MLFVVELIMWNNASINRQNAVCSGVPLYLQLMNPALSAIENIRQLAFIPGSLFLKEFKRIFHDLFGKKSEVYEKIVRSLVTGVKDLSELASALKTPTTGWLSSRVEELILAGFVTRDYTWSMVTGEDSKLSKYRLSDNYLRFYIKHLEKNTDKIERGSFMPGSLYELENWHSISGLQFKNLVLHNRAIIKEILGLSQSSVVSDNPFFQNKTTKQPGCQIDYLIQAKFNGLYICEIKFSKNLIELSIIDEMKNKIKNLKTPKGFSIRSVLIHANGVHDSVIESRYFANIIDLGEYLNGSFYIDKIN